MNFLTQISKLSVILIIVLFVVSCNNKSEQINEQEYSREVNEWHQQRIKSLEEKDSWLSLAGLHQIEPGTSTFGADSSNDIVFPPKAAANIGTITREDSSFSVSIRSGVEVIREEDSTQVSEMNLQTTADDELTTLRHGSLLWYIIERRGNYYIRIKDTEHPNFASFDGIERFPVSKKWRIKAHFEPFEEPKTISIPDVLGDVYQDSLYGMLEFTIDGKQYRLAPLGHPQNSEDFFIIFGDQTNGESTYGGGRYIHIPLPNEEGNTYLDFNKAYNPPCVFTDYATCPLPPEPNRLPIKVTAGEKMYGESH